MSMPCKPHCGRIFVLVLFGIAALGGLVMLLWNWLMPELFFGAKEITYLQALGLLVLSKILFGGFRGHERWHCSRPEHMTQEEREKLHAGIRRWCGRKNDDSAPAENKQD
jgi:hypothetical protein